MSLLSRVLHRLRKTLYKPAIVVTPHPALRSLGYAYGAWHFVDNGSLKGATVISAGLGEDASFDVAFAAAYGARVIIVDPTPRAVMHFDQIKARLGQGAEASFAADGKQPAAAYDLSKLDADNLTLVPAALWVAAEPVRFYPPQNLEHVSFSITDFQRDYAKDGDFIEVPGVTVAGLMQEAGVAELPLIKLDIEGAETEVLTHMLAAGIRPGQILVEYDEVHRPSAANKAKVEACDRALRAAGYTCVHRKGDSDFSYLRTA
jgi:FkbM family methyltransferase